MASDNKPPKQKALPSSRFARLSRMARLASGVAGGMVAEGVKQWSKGQRPSMRDLLLTPNNAERVAERLSEMRGAAMKLGQMLSMDTGDFLPKPLADALSQLRAEAHTLPQKQTRATLQSIYGLDWPELFARFDIEPFAAASIGQVHKAQLHDGRDIVVKLQYPGVLASIDADVDNMATLLRWSGLVPEQVDVAPLLESVKQQLKDEADYELEANHLRSFGEALQEDARFWVPDTVDELSNKHALAMSFVPGEPIESLEHAEQDTRDRVMTALIELLLIELFELRLVQTDPNFANYRYDYPSGRIVLLDFGATRAFKVKFVNDYRSLAKAAVAGNTARMLAAADRLGYAIGDTEGPYRDLILDVFNIALEPLSTPGVYDFGQSDMPSRMMALSNKITEHKDFWQAPPAEAIYFHRKIGGMFMLAHRLQARVPVYDLFQAAIKS
ncbi:MAG: ABC1 kinase family protein [Aequoribacter sp.]|uniref:ABC1 kinase family protein n=1 Tax=Aequoribacter sp. TaxID=2847771 RepID=UPI003C4D5163